MKKPFLLLAGYGYYPSSGTGDWLRTYETREEAMNDISIEKPGDNNDYQYRYYTKQNDGNWLGVDWYEIVDLRKWTDN